MVLPICICFLLKVCGQAPVSSPGGQCCVAVNLDNSENNFQDGGVSRSLTRVMIMAQCYLPMGSMLPAPLNKLYSSSTPSGEENWSSARTSTWAG